MKAEKQSVAIWPWKLAGFVVHADGVAGEPLAHFVRAEHAALFLRMPQVSELLVKLAACRSSDAVPHELLKQLLDLADELGAAARDPDWAAWGVSSTPPRRLTAETPPHLLGGVPW